MNTLKKAILSLLIALLVLLGLAKFVFATDKGKAKEDANLRKTMDDTSTILEIIPKNDEFEVLEDQGDWYRVNYQKIRGYVKKEQVEMLQNKDNGENSEVSNLTNENQVTEEVQNTQSEETNTVAEETNTEAQEENHQQENIEVGATVYIKSEIKIHLRPLLSSMKIETLKKNQEVKVLEMASQWVYIEANQKTGWVRKDSLTTTKPEEPKEEKKTLNKTGYITVEQINFRKKPDTNSSVIDTLTQNTKVTILEEDGKWYKVSYNGKEGYIAKKYISEKKTEVTSRSSTKRGTTGTKTTTNTKTEKAAAKEATTTQTSSKGSSAVAIAKKYLGSRYVYGGSSPSGFDCSGFTMYVYKQVGVSLPHSSSAQANKGTKVEKANLQPGDIVFFKNFRSNKGIGHCGIYIGNNQFIHASTEKTGVITSSLSSSAYQKRYVKAIRIF